MLGAATLAAFPRARRRIARADWAGVAAIAVIGNALPALLFTPAETELDSAVAGMLTSAAPLSSLLIAGLMLRSLPGRAQAIGITLGFGGIVLMTVPSVRGADAAPMGIALVLAAVVAYGLNGNLIVPMQQRYGGPALTMWALIVSSVVLAPFGAAGIGDSEFATGPMLAVLILGVIGTGIARSLAATLAGRAGAPRMSTTTYLIPVVALVLGATFRDEVVHPPAIAGMAVVLVGAWVATRAVKSAAEGPGGSETSPNPLTHLRGEGSTVP